MNLYRISHKNYANSLNSSGAANRWNLSNELVIYSSGTRSLATLELIVHRNSIKHLADYKLMIISVPDKDDCFTEISHAALPENWRSFSAYHLLQQLGSHWYRNGKSVILKVPSAVIPEEWNYIINTTHPKFQEQIVLLKNEPYFFDPRLFG